MSGLNSLIRFSVHGQEYALHLSAVERIVRAVEITPLPGAPAAVKGVISLQGQLIPVVALRTYLGLPDKKLDLEDRLIIVHAGDRLAAVIVDEVEGVVEVPAAHEVPLERIGPGGRSIDEAVQIGDRVVLIFDPGGLLSDEDTEALDEAVKKAG